MSIALSHQITSRKIDRVGAAKASQVPTQRSLVPARDLLQRKEGQCACGGGCPRCRERRQPLQSQFAVSEPGDVLEREADQIADRVMRMSISETAAPKNGANSQSNSTPSTIHRKCEACEEVNDEVAEKFVMRKESFASVAPTPPADAPPSIKNVIRSRGQPLDFEIRSFFEPRFGAELSQVRIHTDSAGGRSARAIDAKAYTLGHHIVFGSGEYSPHTESGKYLVAHELAHVQRQAGFGTHHPLPRDGFIQRKKAGGAGTSQIRLLSYEEAADILGDAMSTSIDQSNSALTVIEKTLEMPFTNQNSDLRIKRLVAAISLLEASDAAIVYTALTSPANEKQKHLKERFGRLASRFRKPLFDLLQQKANAPAAKSDDAQEAQPKYHEGKAVWVEMHPGVFGYVPEPGMTLGTVASYLSTNPHLVEGLAKLNNGIAADKPLEPGQPVIVPIELVNRDQAIGEMSVSTRQQIGSALQANAQAAQVERLIRVKPGLRGPGMHGLFPVTTASLSQAASVVAKAVEALWKIMKGAAYGIAFAGGVVHGFLASLWDTVSGIAKMIYGLLDSIFSGDLKSDITKFIDGLKQLTWDKVKEMIGDWAAGWEKKLNSPSPWVAGHAHGYLTGYVMAEAAMLLLSGGTTAGLKAAFWTSRIGIALKASSAFIAAEQKVAKLVEAGGKVAEVVDRIRDSRVGGAIKAVEKGVEVAGWTVDKIGKALSLPGDIAVYVVEKALTHAKRLGPFFERIGNLTSNAKKWLFGCRSPCNWAPDIVEKLMVRFADEEIEILCNSANRLELMQKKWFEKTVSAGGDLPDGYHWRDGDIVRNPGKRKAEYAPLAYDKQSKKIKVGISGERISNPSVMNRNYKLQVRETIKERYKGKKLSDKDLDTKVAKEVSEHAVHHLIPDNLVQDHPLGKAARKAGYDLDRGPNLQGLRKNQDLTNMDAGDIGHWSSHPKYDALVEAQLTKVQKALEKEFKSLDKVPNERMLDEMKKIEDMFRKEFQNSTVPIDPKTGRLVELTRLKAEEELYAAVTHDAGGQGERSDLSSRS